MLLGAQRSTHSSVRRDLACPTSLPRHLRLKLAFQHLTSHMSCLTASRWLSDGSCRQACSRPPHAPPPPSKKTAAAAAQWAAQLKTGPALQRRSGQASRQCAGVQAPGPPDGGPPRAAPRSAGEDAREQGEGGGWLRNPQLRRQETADRGSCGSNTVERRKTGGGSVVGRA